MDVVVTLDQIFANIEELERRKNASDGEWEEYCSLIRRGRCFFPYISSTGTISFIPSRFVGYIGNKLTTHKDNLERDGRITNPAIDGILGIDHSKSISLEYAFINFCRSIGVTPIQVQRTYWETLEVIELLEKNAENGISQDQNITETEKEQLIKARVGQGIFRENLINMWGKCCITGCNYVKILRASHIKPWRDSTNAERLDKFNGFLLSPNFDALFDKGLISFTDSGDMVVSKSLPNSAQQSLGCSSSKKICLQPGHIRYLAWHRKHVFVDDIDECAPS